MARHALGAPREREGHSGQEGLGDQGHRDADAEHEGIGEGSARDEGDHQEEQAHAQGDECDEAYDAAEREGEGSGGITRCRGQA